MQILDKGISLSAFVHVRPCMAQMLSVMCIYKDPKFNAPLGGRDMLLRSVAMYCVGSCATCGGLSGGLDYH